MITLKTLTETDIQDEWLQEALTKGLKECITAPIMVLDPTKPEPVRRAEMILENFSREDYPVKSTLVVPGNIIQMILPKDEILLTILFQYSNNRNINIRVLLQKLEYEESVPDPDQ